MYKTYKMYKSIKCIKRIKALSKNNLVFLIILAEHGFHLSGKNRQDSPNKGHKRLERCVTQHQAKRNEHILLIPTPWTPNESRSISTGGAVTSVQIKHLVEPLSAHGK